MAYLFFAFSPWSLQGLAAATAGLVSTLPRHAIEVDYDPAHSHHISFWQLS
ncbi:hypothetical protein IF2G_06706 [Cordyceps javanica]|nr:hypothetical protein IF2G_06706 [Cordyceps javanica]